jgi:hypothetical protein
MCAVVAGISSAPPQLTDTESRRLPDSPMRGVRESTKGKIKALDLYVCLLLQESLVQLKHACAKKTVHFKFFNAVDYDAVPRRLFIPALQ